MASRSLSSMNPILNPLFHPTVIGNRNPSVRMKLPRKPRRLTSRAWKLRYNRNHPHASTRSAGAPTGPQAGKSSGRPSKGVVVLAIGLPGSGKTTWFKRRGVTPLSSDMLRSILFDDITEQRYQGLVFSTLRSLLRARLIARMPWNYVDASNLAPHERRQWIKMAKGFGYEVHAVFFDVPLEVCLERNRKRERQVKEDVIQRMAAKLKAPGFEEGFGKITVVRVKRSGEQTLISNPVATPWQNGPGRISRTTKMQGNASTTP